MVGAEWSRGRCGGMHLALARWPCLTALSVLAVGSGNGVVRWASQELFLLLEMTNLVTV